MIFKHFWEVVGVAMDYLNRCYPSFFSALLSSTSFKKKKIIYARKEPCTFTVKTKEPGIVQSLLTKQTFNSIRYIPRWPVGLGSQHTV